MDYSYYSLYSSYYSYYYWASYLERCFTSNKEPSIKIHLVVNFKAFGLEIIIKDYIIDYIIPLALDMVHTKFIFKDYYPIIGFLLNHNLDNYS